MDVSSLFLTNKRQAEERGDKRMSRLEKKKEHITGGRLCHGVNGVLPLPIMPEPFEPWPLHTERSLTLSSASSWGPRRLNDLSVSAWRPRPCSQLSVRYVRAVPTLQQPESAGLELSAGVSSRFTSVQHMKGKKHQNMQIRLTADGEIHHGLLEPITFRLSGAGLGGGLAARAR